MQSPLARLLRPSRRTALTSFALLAAASSLSQAQSARAPLAPAPETKEVASLAGAPLGGPDQVSPDALEPERESAASGANAIEYGMNPNQVGWSNREIPFADAMTRASEFGLVQGGSISFNPVPIIPLGQTPALVGEGWPDLSQLNAGETAGVRLFNNMNGSVPDGRVTPYVVTWIGDGSCTLKGNPVQSEQNRTSNRVEFKVDPTIDSQIWLNIDDSNPQNPVRKVHVWLPGMEGTGNLFWPPYLEKVQDMNNGEGPYMWRTLNWNRTRFYGSTGNGSFVFDLEGSIRPDSPSQGTRRGVCPEFQVALCNEVGANLHYTLPHRTDDMSLGDYVTYVEDVLTRIRDGSPAVPGINGGRPFDGLDPDLTLTIEYSNEIWNTSFPVNSWTKSEAARKGITFEAQIATQVDLVFLIADSVFSGADASRLRKYVGGWIASDQYLEDVLDNLLPGTHVDSVGVATYFGPRQTTIQNWLVGANTATGSCPNCPSTLGVLLAAYDAIDDLAANLTFNRQVAEGYINPDGSTPAYEIYEAGQSILAQGAPWEPQATLAQFRPEMYYLYTLFLVPLLIDEEVDLVNWFSFMTDQTASGGGGLGDAKSRSTSALRLLEAVKA